MGTSRLHLNKAGSASQNSIRRYAMRLDGDLISHSLMEENAMKASIRLSGLLTFVLLLTGCTGNMRHSNRQLSDQVRLPSAPKLEPSPTSPSVPNMSAPANPSPLSASGAQRPTGSY
jgi:hypothetical protein